MARRIASCAVALCALLVAGAAGAEEAVDLEAEFLEFLANLDSDDEAWAEFLEAAETDKALDQDEKAKPAPPKDEKVKGEDKGEGDDEP